MRRLLPEPAADIELDELLAELRPWENAPEDRPYVLTNFALTLDGRATIAGRSGPIAGPADTSLLVGLRTRVHAVMIGAETLRAERYGRIIRSQAKRERRERLGLPHDPLAVIVGSMDLPWDAPLFTEGGRVLIFTTDDAERPPTKSSVRVVRHEGERVDLRAALEYLRHERGVTSLLCEGGPHLHGELIAAGLVDELFITRAPKIAGGEGPGLVADIDEHPLDAELVWLLHDPETDDLFGRYRLAGS
ncbi:MAG TPA: dihydrofolate reductase family protein [Solirubrobacterales bacterium]|jgi:riboflavin-specific deaminase-like protein